MSDILEEAKKLYKELELHIGDKWKQIFLRLIAEVERLRTGGDTFHKRGSHFVEQIESLQSQLAKYKIKLDLEIASGNIHLDDLRDTKAQLAAVEKERDTWKEAHLKLKEMYSEEFKQKEKLEAENSELAAKYFEAEGYLFQYSRGKDKHALEEIKDLKEWGIEHARTHSCLFVGEA